MRGRPGRVPGGTAHDHQGVLLQPSQGVFPAQGPPGGILCDRRSLPGGDHGHPRGGAGGAGIVAGVYADRYACQQEARVVRVFGKGYTRKVAAVGYRFLTETGKFVGRLLPLRNPSGLFFFFPFYHIGGAERVHADIVSCVADRRPWVLFAKRSRDDALKGEFGRSCRMFTWWFLLKYCYPVSAGILAGIINRHGKATVFGCNSLFFYKLLPLLDSRAAAMDLLHAFGGGA